MFGNEVVGLFAGAIALGAVHGVEPGHGWPVAASYALDQGNKWLYGFAASFILGVGHLVSSIAMVAAFFYAKAYFDLTQVNDPITVLGGVELGGPVSLVAGVLLVALGIREYRHGHSHDHGAGGHSHDHGAGGHSHDHGVDDHSRSHGDTGEAAVSQVAADVNAVYDERVEHHDAHDHDHDAHDHDHDHDAGGVVSRVRGVLPFVETGSQDHGDDGHGHGGLEEAADRGLWGIAWFAFVLGFAHEEEFEIIALCAGSTYCLELMLTYALTVVAGIVGLTLLLIAGYEHSEERVAALTPYLPAFSATVLVAMGVGFVLGVF